MKTDFVQDTEKTETVEQTQKPPKEDGLESAASSQC